jgi:hypothetical protein
MILNSTKYKNPQRTILGAINFVFNGDTIILCDTALGIVNLTLLDIPNDQWNTTYKLYVADKSNNAGTNNITIIAPVGYLINGATSLVISNNGGCALIRVTENKQYLASLTSGGGGLAVLNQSVPLVPSATSMNFLGIQASAVGSAVTIKNAFISGTSLSIQLLISSGSLIANQWYNITDAKYGNFNHNFNVFVPALTNNSLSTLGIGEFYNADYQVDGVYSGIVGFAGQLGIWNSALITPINSVVIWNNLHYKNLTGVNGITDPSVDLVNWLVLPYSKTNGYILVYNEVTYGFKNKIYSRKDDFLNEVELFVFGVGLSSFDKFPFGNAFFKSNKVLNSSYWDCCNTKIGIEVFDNILNFAELLWTTLANINICSSNNFLGTRSPIEWRTGDISLVIISNNFAFCGGTSTLQDCNFGQNNFINSSFDFRVSGGVNIAYNNINFSTISFTKTNGNFLRNKLNYSEWTIVNSTGIENQNIANNSIINIEDNAGIIKFNEINQESRLLINNIIPSGEFAYNTIDFKSLIMIDEIDSQFGDGGVKGLGNIYSYCIFKIGIFTGDIYGNNFSKVDLDITIFSGAIGLCDFQGESVIKIADMQNHTFVSLTAKGFTYGSVGWLMPESYANGGIYTQGLANIKCTLDCSDSSIYDPVLFNLTIPNELRKFGGVFTLKNASGININQILNTFDKAPYTFFNDAGATTFTTTSVGVAVLGELISTTIAPAVFIINYRTNGSDYIVTNRNGNLMAITETSIFV